MAETQNPRKNLRRLVLILWILVAVFYFFLSYDYINVTMADRKLAEYLAYVVNLAGTEHRPAKEVRTLILVKADELGLPLKTEHITVSGLGPTLSVFVDYEADIEFPGLQRVLYRKVFQHDIKYHQQ